MLFRARGLRSENVFFLIPPHHRREMQKLNLWIIETSRWSCGRKWGETRQIKSSINLLLLFADASAPSAGFTILTLFDSLSISTQIAKNFYNFPHEKHFFFSFFVVFLFNFLFFLLRAHRHFDTREIYPQIWSGVEPNCASQIDTAPHRISAKALHDKVHLETVALSPRKLCNLELFSSFAFTHPISSLFFLFLEPHGYWKKVPFTASPTMRMCVVL